LQVLRIRQERTTPLMLINRPLRYCRYISTVTYSTPSVLLQLCSDKLKNYLAVILKYTVRASTAGTKEELRCPGPGVIEQDCRDVEFITSIMGLKHPQAAVVEVAFQVLCSPPTSFEIQFQHPQSQPTDKHNQWLNFLPPSFLLSLPVHHL